MISTPYHEYDFYREVMKAAKCKTHKDCKTECQYIELAPLPQAVPSVAQQFFGYDACIKQEGTTPMRYTDNSAIATASVATQPTDASVTRDYLLTRLAKADYPKYREFRKLFNLYVDNTPKTYKEMIDIIKSGTYTLDEKITKRVDAAQADFDEVEGDEDLNFVSPWGPLYGIVWPGPKSDQKGYDAAVKENGTRYTAAKDAIMVGTAAEGLAAIQAFEAWTPTVTAQ